MTPVVTANDMRWCDATAIRRFGIPGLLLMDRAGTGAAHVISDRFRPPAGSRIDIVCGTGNNAGDGFVVARAMSNAGLRVRVLLTGTSSHFSPDAAAQLAMLRRQAKAMPGSVSIGPFSRATASAGDPAVVVDAVFGTGFTGEPRRPQAIAIEWMNDHRGRIAALDVPSGLDATTGAASTACVRADLTVAFGALKTGMLINDGPDMTGHVVVVDIGIPEPVVNDRRFQTFLFELDDVRRLMSARPRRLHKYSAGKVVVIAGARGYTGAAALANIGALRSGAGAVVAAVPDTIYEIVAKKLTEQIILPVPAGPSGGFGPASLPALRDRLAWADAVVVGPGLGRGSETQEFLKNLLGTYRGPAVIDADALVLLAGIEREIAGRKDRDWILTPHAGEASSLMRRPVAEVEADRLESSRTYAQRHRLTLLLKGAPTCVASPDGRVTINSSGNPGMATVGSGDVLAGLIGGLRAQGLPSADAAAAGAYVHGSAGDLARREVGERALVAGDIVEFLPRAMRQAESSA